VCVFARVFARVVWCARLPLACVCARVCVCVFGFASVSYLYNFVMILCKEHILLQALLFGPAKMPSVCAWMHVVL